MQLRPSGTRYCSTSSTWPSSTARMTAAVIDLVRATYSHVSSTRVSRKRPVQTVFAVNGIPLRSGGRAIHWDCLQPEENAPPEDWRADPPRRPAQDRKNVV